MILALFLACASEHDDAQVSGVGEGGSDVPVQTESKTETLETVSTKVEVAVTPRVETKDKTKTTSKSDIVSEETQATEKTE